LLRLRLFALPLPRAPWPFGELSPPRRQNVLCPNPVELVQPRE
jgi:hypothetical protein